MVCVLLWLAGVSEIGAAPEGTLTIAMPFSSVTRMDDIMATAIPGFYMSPYEDLKLRAR